MIGRLVSFWDGLFSKAMLVSGRVYAPRGILTLHILIPTTLPSSRTQQVTPPGYRTKDALETEILRINPWRLREGPKRRIQTSQRSPTTFFGSTGRAHGFFQRNGRIGRVVSHERTVRGNPWYQSKYIMKNYFWRCHIWLGERRKEAENKFLTTRLACYIRISCTHGLVQDANTLLQKKTVVVRDPFSNAAGWLEEVRNMKRSESIPRYSNQPNLLFHFAQNAALGSLKPNLPPPPTFGRLATRLRSWWHTVLGVQTQGTAYDRNM